MVCYFVLLVVWLRYWLCDCVTGCVIALPSCVQCCFAYTPCQNMSKTDYFNHFLSKRPFLVLCWCQNMSKTGYFNHFLSKRPFLVLCWCQNMSKIDQNHAKTTQLSSTWFSAHRQYSMDFWKHVKNDVKNRWFSFKNTHFLDVKVRLQSSQNVTTWFSAS